MRDLRWKILEMTFRITLRNISMKPNWRTLNYSKFIHSERSLFMYLSGKSLRSTKMNSRSFCHYWERKQSVCLLNNPFQEFFLQGNCHNRKKQSSKGYGGEDFYRKNKDISHTVLWIIRGWKGMLLKSCKELFIRFGLATRTNLQKKK